MMREYVNLANLLTSGSLIAGFLALFLILQTNNHLIAAAGLVAAAAICDMPDGHVARPNGAADDDFGTNLDSLADVVSFGAVRRLRATSAPRSAGGSGLGRADDRHAPDPDDLWAQEPGRAFRGGRGRPPRGRSRLADREVHQPPGHVDALADLTPLDVRPHLLAGQSELFGKLLRDVRRRLDAVAELAVDLHDERDLFGRYKTLVPLGPSPFVHRVRLPHQPPHLLGVVRRERGEDEHERPQCLRPLALPHLTLDRQQVIRVLHERR